MFAKFAERAFPSRCLMSHNPNKPMKVQDVMTYDVQTCRPETNLADAAMRMWKGDFGILPVVAEDKTVVGLITDRDICMAAATKHRDPAKIRVKEAASRNVYRSSPDTDIREALKIMRQHQVRRLPITRVEDGRLVGMLSINDVALKARGAAHHDLTAQDVEETLSAICAHPERSSAKPEPQMATA